MNKRRGRGRPPGESGARQNILDVARRRFLRDGYERVTMRSVAEEAGVDAALISYHFGSKKGLFGATMALAANPADLLAEVLAGARETMPERLLRAIVTAWDDRETGSPLRSFADAAIREPDVARLFREMAEREMQAQLAEHIGGADARARAGIVLSQVAGVILTRYVFGIEPMASMAPDELVARVAPVLRTALAGPPPRRRAGLASG